MYSQRSFSPRVMPLPYVANSPNLCDIVIAMLSEGFSGSARQSEQHINALDYKIGVVYKILSLGVAPRGSLPGPYPVPTNAH